MRNLHAAMWSTAVVAALAGLPSIGISGTATTFQTLSATLSPIGKLSVPASLVLTHTGTTFSSYSASLTLSNRVRATSSGGGTVTAQVSADFTPSGGPTASSGVLTYTCSSASYGSGCTGTQTASTSSQTPVLTFPASACTGPGTGCSTSSPNTIQIQFVLTDNASFKTNTYSAQVTFTISAT